MLLQVAILSVAILGPAQNETGGTSNVNSAQQVEALYAEGAALYHARKYRAALDRFEQAYTMYPEPNLLYNMGRSYEALGDIDKAMQRYKQCSGDPQTTPEVAQKARARLQMLQTAKTQSNNVNEVNPTFTNQNGGGNNAPVNVEPEKPFPVLLAAAGGTGGLGLVTGIASGILFGVGAAMHGEVVAAKNDADSRDGVAPMKMVDAQQKVTDGETLKTIGVSGFVIGGVLLLSAVPLVIVHFVNTGEGEVAEEAAP